MKFTMFKKETEDNKYRDNPYRAVNFPISENGNPVCPTAKNLHIFIVDLLREISIAGQKNYTNAKTVLIVLTKRNVVNAKATGIVRRIEARVIRTSRRERKQVFGG